MLVYDPEKQTIEGPNIDVVPFYCGREVNALSTILYDLKSGYLTLQEAYTLLYDHVDMKSTDEMWFM